jgi:hypothetical protein
MVIPPASTRSDVSGTDRTLGSRSYAHSSSVFEVNSVPCQMRLDFST